MAERDALVKEIRGSGDRTLANAVKALRKPSAVAAEVNQIVRDDPDGIDLILQAAALLRSAQAGALEGTEINAAELQQQYRAAIQALAQSATTRRVEVRAALEAATIDEASNEDLRSGCLVVVPTPTSIFGSAAPSSAALEVETEAHSESEASPEQPVDELEERRERRRANKAAKKPTATTAASAANAERKRKAAQKEAAEKAAAAREAAEAQAAAKQAAAEAERQRKAAEKERQKKRKDAQKRHRDAVRNHLTALDAEAAAAMAAEQAEQDVNETDREIATAEQTLAELRVLRDRRVADLDRRQQAMTDTQRRAAEAQEAVDTLAEALAALEGVPHE